jgi:predicted membrane channel-forming protein YqfA (hemolysin III family)
MNLFLIFVLTLGDSLCGCLQVSNIVHRRRVSAFLVSMCMGACKIGAILFVVKSTSGDSLLAYLLGGAVGAQTSLCFNKK